MDNTIYKNNVLYQIGIGEGRIVGGNYEYNITDHLGNLRVAFKDSAGIAKIVQANSYGVWGEDLPTLKYLNTPKINNFGYLNREFQPETGYTDLVNRQFDNIVGRFTSQDPVIEGQEHLSLYQYSNNNPVLRSDPNGRFPGEGLWKKFVDGVKSLSVWAGSVLTESSNLRKTYKVESAKLTEKTPENNLKRLELKANVRDATPQPIKSILDKSRPMSGEIAKVEMGTVNNPSKTNVAADALAEKLGTAGKVMTGVGVVISVANIAISETPVKQTAIEAGGWSGAYGGGVLAAEAASASGNPYVIGASGAVGAIVGGIFGKEAVKQMQSMPKLNAITLLPH